MRTLVFDGDPLTRQWLEATLRFRGHDVAECATPERAREVLGESPWALMVLDFAGSDGVALCRWIRARRDGDQGVILAAGVSDRPSEIQGALDAGADDYLHKAADAGTLNVRFAVAEQRAHRRQARARAAADLRRLQKAVETMRIGVCVTDTQGRTLYVNPAEAEMHGYEVHELMAQDARILSPSDQWRRMAPAELRDAAPWRRERMRRRRDGTTFPVQLFSDVVRSAEGSPVGIVTTCEDISERKRGEEALRESEHRYRSLVDAAPDVILTVSPDATLTSLNPAFEGLTGWPPSAWLGRGLAPLVHPDDFAGVLSVFERVLKGEAAQQAELRLVTRSGETRVVEYGATGQVVGGEVVGVLTIARDITARKKQQRIETTLHAATRALAEAPTLAEAGRRLLNAVCVGLGWEVGLLWTYEKEPDALRCDSLWHVPSLDASALWQTVREGRLPRGYGLPGLVLESVAPLWIPDLATDERVRRRRLQAAETFRSALVFPVISGVGVVAVVELLSSEARTVDPHVLREAGELGTRLGLVLSQRQAEEALRASEERYSLAARGANDGLWDWNLKTDEIHLSVRWKEMLGYEASEVGHAPSEWLDRVHPEDRDGVAEKLTAHREGRTTHFEAEYRMRHKSGGYRWVLGRGFALRDAEGTAYRIAGAQTDVTDRQTHDPLTGLPNRALFVDRLEQALARSKRPGGPPFAVLFVDLDGFKSVNDTLGHLAGDEVLTATALRLQSCLRPGDALGRFGGDEFAILLDGIGGVGDATRVADRIQQELGLALNLGGQALSTSASIGIALSSTGYDTAGTVLRDAAAALCRAKALGKGGYEVYDGAMRAAMVATLEREADLKRGLEASEFHPVFQPLVSLTGGQVTGFEILARWHHPDRGILSPHDFMGLAEESGLILPLGYALLLEACTLARSWRERAPHSFSLSVNLSSRQFGDPALVERVGAVLSDTGFEAGSLRFEVTEGVIHARQALAEARIEEIRALGAHVDLDNFGTGHASLGHLRRLSIGAVKVDRSLVQGRPGQEGSDALVRAILMLARGLDREVVAVGIETAYQAGRLKALGCSQGQGSYFSPPLEADEAVGLLDGEAPWPAIPGRPVGRRWSDARHARA